MATARDCPCVLVGTKLDLKEEFEASGDPEQENKVVTTEEIRKAAREYNFSTSIECSAKKFKGLNEVFLRAFTSVF